MFKKKKKQYKVIYIDIWMQQAYIHNDTKNNKKGYGGIEVDSVYRYVPYLSEVKMMTQIQ